MLILDTLILLSWYLSLALARLMAYTGHTPPKTDYHMQDKLTPRFVQKPTHWGRMTNIALTLSRPSTSIMEYVTLTPIMTPSQSKDTNQPLGRCPKFERKESTMLRWYQNWFLFTLIKQFCWILVLPHYVPKSPNLHPSRWRSADHAFFERNN